MLRHIVASLQLLVSLETGCTQLAESFREAVGRYDEVQEQATVLQMIYEDNGEPRIAVQSAASLAETCGDAKVIYEGLAKFYHGEGLRYHGELVQMRKQRVSLERLQGK
jgi:hypothetical protein